MGDFGECRHFIPLARSELIDLLLAHPGLAEADRKLLRCLGDLVTTAYHSQYQRRLLELKAAYLPFDPDADTTALIPRSAAERQHRLNELFSDVGWVLERAHFKHLSRDDIEPVLDSASDWGIRMDVDFSVFERLAIFARGDAVQKRTRRRWWNLYREEQAEVPVYRRLVLVLKLRQHPRLGPRVATESVFLKVFKDIPKLDVMMLLPGARVRLSRLDRGKIGLPLLSGLGLAAWNLFQHVAQTLETLLMSPNALWGLAAGSIGYGYKSFYGYVQTKQRYHLALTQSLYFQNLDSNAGVLTRLLDEAEEQECRTAILAYFCLWHYGAEGMTVEDLDASMELYLDRFANQPLLTVPGEALAKLRGLGLVQEVDGRCHALPLPRALEVLHALCVAALPSAAHCS